MLPILIEDCNYNDLKGKCGVYALIDENDVPYIGSTVNLFQRIRFHNACFNDIIKKGYNAFENSYVNKSVMRGMRFRLVILASFAIDSVKLEELREIEQYYIILAGGLTATYNVLAVDGFHSR